MCHICCWHGKPTIAPCHHSVGEKHQAHQTFLMVRSKCLMGDFTNSYRIYKAHQKYVWWTLNVLRLHLWHHMNYYRYGNTLTPEEYGWHFVDGIQRWLQIFFIPRSSSGLRGIVVPRVGGRAAGQTSPVNTLTSIIFHGSFSNLGRTFITLRSRTSSIMEVLPH